MRKFKLIFHIIYVILTLVILYFSIDVLMNTEQYLSRIKLSSYIKFPRYVMIAFLTISVIMIVEFILERVIVYQAKEGISELEDEIVQLKAKLYDRSQEDDGDDAELGDEEDDDDEEED